MSGDRRAVVVGVTGIQGHALTQHLLHGGWSVFGVSRRPPTDLDGVTPIAADLTDEASIRHALGGVDPTHVFFTAWSRQATEAENGAVNGSMLRNLLTAVSDAPSLRHVALTTGLKHYLGPFEAYALIDPDTPFREEQDRLPYENFYYVQEDILWEFADRVDFTWSVHRPHTVIGWAIGEVLLLGDNVMIPDFAFTHKEDGRRALVEIVGFWHPEYLRRKLEKVRAAGRDDLILLVYEGVNLTDDRLQDVPGEVLYFASKPVIKEVMAAVERRAR
jgi:hypothetical protein